MLRAVAATVLAAGSATILLTGCGSAAKSSAGTGGKTLVVALPSGVPANLDTSPFVGATRNFMATAAGSFLWTPASDYNCASPVADNDYTGLLVKSWTTSASGKTITVTLRSNIKSQWGDPLTAEDVKWSVERNFALNPQILGPILQTSFVHYAKNKDDIVQVVNKHTFQLHLQEPGATAVGVWDIGIMQIWDSQAAKRHATTKDPWAKAWVAAHWDYFSPWKLVSFSPSSQATFVPNSGWGIPRGNVSKLVVTGLASTANGAELVQAGSVNVVGSLPFTQVKQLESASGVKVWNCQGLGGDVILLNMRSGPLSKVGVRRALSLAIDRDAIARGATQGIAKPMTAMIPDGQVPKGTSVKRWTTDLPAAKAALAAAGYPNGFTLTLTTSNSEGGGQEGQEAILLQSELKRIGVTVNIKTLASSADFQAALFSGNFEAAIWNADAGVNDGALFYATYAPGSAFGNFGLNDSKLFTYQAEAVGQPLGTTRDGLIVDMANRAFSQAVIIGLVQTPYSVVTGSNISRIGPVTNSGSISTANVVVK